VLKFRFDSLEDFNNFYTNRLISSTNILKLDKSVFVLLNLKEFSLLREVISANLSAPELSQAVEYKLSEFIETNKDLGGQEKLIDEIQILKENYSTSEYNAIQHYIYPYSRTLFMTSFFSDFIPSFSSDFYAYASNKLSIFRQIGTGHGQSVVLKNYNITSQSIVDNINLSCSIVSQIDSVTETIAKVDSIISKQNNDVQYMNAYIVELENLVADLKSQLDDERKQGVNGYHRTWH
jgi:hypothetical protein